MGQKVITPWGWWKVLSQKPGYKLKALYINAGHRTSLQRHKYRTERWQVICGVGSVYVKDRTSRVRIGDVMTIPRGIVHRISAAPSSNLLILETQLGRCRENDIKRLEDDYGRA